jgi:alanyl-tRNA synthetase
MIGLQEPFFSKVSGVVADLMEESYPELSDKRSYVAKVILHEEERFIRTLDRGLQLLEAEVEKVLGAGSRVIPGDVVFKLYDTYGFPVDLTADIVRDRNIVLDEAGFEAEMEAQRDKARRAWKGSGEEAVDQVYRELKAAAGAVKFVGYETIQAKTRVLALALEGKTAQAAGAGARVDIVLAESPFYGESGGQMGDAGTLSGPGLSVRIETTIKPLADFVVLRGVVEKGEIKMGDVVMARVDDWERFATTQNHSATHLLQAALRDVLGDHVKQAGSLVGADRMRFDFSHFAAMTREELRRVEEQVNAWVAENHAIAITEETHDQAVADGVTALFGEKYGDLVRVVRMGVVSAELCGGTHARSTGDIGLFKILSESGVAAGVRRIEAATGRRALERVWALEDRLEEVAQLTKASPEEAPERVRKLQAAVKELEREVTSLRGKLAGGASRDILTEKREIAGVSVLAARAPTSDPKGLREFADTLRDRLGSGAFVLGAEADGKAVLLVTVTPDLTGRLKAGDLIRPLAEIVGGKGGGKPEMAQAGGPNPARLDEALEKFYSEVESRLKA